MRSIHEKIASSALAIYGHEGNFEIGFIDARDCAGLTAAFEKLGCKVTALLTKNHLSVVARPTSLEPQS